MITNLLPVHCLKIKAIVHKKDMLTDEEMEFMDEICFFYLCANFYELSEAKINKIDRIYRTVRYGRNFCIENFKSLEYIAL